MAVPILALDYLQRSADDSFFYSPELDVRKDATAKKANLELDFCCCVDGQLMIGQATARDSLADTAGKEEERLAVNRDIASAIRAGRFIS